MKNSTAYLPGFSHRLFRRESLNEVKRLRTQSNALDGLAASVARFVASEDFDQEGDRERIYTPVGHVLCILWAGARARECMPRSGATGPSVASRERAIGAK